MSAIWPFLRALWKRVETLEGSSRAGLAGFCWQRATILEMDSAQSLVRTACNYPE